MAAGFLDDFSEHVVGVSGEVSAGGDHRNDRFGEVCIKAGEGVAESSVPATPENGFDFGRLAGAMPDGGDEGWRCGVEAGPCQIGDLAMGGDGGG